MNAIRNKVQLIGRVGKDPEILNLETGNKLAKFSLATNGNYTNAKGEKVETTDWHNIVAWGKTADIVEQFVNKGKEIAVDGKLTTRSWEDKDGQKRFMTEVVCNELLLLSK